MTKNKYIIAGMAISGITILDSIALSHGINGVAMSVSVGGIGTIAGYVLKYVTEKRS